jgi:osmotically-inducible protein OsmY
MKAVASPSTQELTSRIKHRIHSRTHGRVWNLHVEIDGQAVVLRGRTSTYYTKQLAQHGALEITNGKSVVNDIEVRKVA